MTKITNLFAKNLLWNLIFKSCYSKFAIFDNILTSSQVSNSSGVVLEIYLDHKYQWPQEGLNCESVAYEEVI